MLLFGGELFTFLKESGRGSRRQNRKDGQAARLFFMHFSTTNKEERKLLRREKNRVNYVDHTVGRFDVGNNDFHGVVQEDFAILYGDGDILA